MTTRRAVFAGAGAGLLTALLGPTGNAQAAATFNTNGDVMAIEMIYLQRPLVAIGGNFTKACGVAAKHLAVIDPATNQVVFAGNMGGYVRALKATAMRLFVGGDFSGYAKALDIGNGYATISSWKPSAISNKVNALSFDSAGLYLGTGVELRKVRLDTGATLWSRKAGGGPVRAIMAIPDWNRVYVGGLFEDLGGVKRHGFQAVLPGDGSPDWYFAPSLTPESAPDGSGYDGEGVLSLAADGKNFRVIAGTDSQTETPGNWLRVVDRYTGSGAGLEHLHRRTVGGCQSVQVLGGDRYFTGYHNNHGDQYWLIDPGYGHYASLRSAVTGNLIPNASLSALNGLRVNTNDDHANGGVQCSVWDHTSGRLFIGGAFSKPQVSLAAVVL